MEADDSPKKSSSASSDSTLLDDITPINEEHKRAALNELIERGNYEMAMRYVKSWSTSELSRLSNLQSLVNDIVTMEMSKRAR